jgi:hypothetical protein
VVDSHEFCFEPRSRTFLLSRVVTAYLIWGHARSLKVEEKTTSRFVEKDGVSMDTDVGDLAGTAHVLVDGGAGIV